MATKDWKQGSNLTWYYHGNKRMHHNQIYIDHIVPEKGWRFVAVGKYSWDNVEQYFPTKMKARGYANQWMRGH